MTTAFTWLTSMKNVPKGREREETLVTVYAYTGTEAVGGTLIASTSIVWDSLVNGIISSLYTQPEEDAIKIHQIELLKDAGIAKKPDCEAKWKEFNSFRTTAISTIER